MATNKKTLNNNKKSAPKTESAPNNTLPTARDYQASWQLEYDKLSEAEKNRVDIAKRDEEDGCYKRDWLVDAFVLRVIENVENPVTDKQEAQ